jgi:hypothetical protein
MSSMASFPTYLRLDQTCLERQHGREVRWLQDQCVVRQVFEHVFSRAADECPLQAATRNRAHRDDGGPKRARQSRHTSAGPPTFRWTFSPSSRYSAMSSFSSSRFRSSSFAGSSAETLSATGAPPEAAAANNFHGQIDMDQMQLACEPRCHQSAKSLSKGEYDCGCDKSCVRAVQLVAFAESLV